MGWNPESCVIDDVLHYGQNKIITIVCLMLVKSNYGRLSTEKTRFPECLVLYSFLCCPSTKTPNKLWLLPSNTLTLPTVLLFLQNFICTKYGIIIDFDWPALKCRAKLTGRYQHPCWWVSRFYIFHRTLLWKIKAV